MRANPNPNPDPNPSPNPNLNPNPNQVLAELEVIRRDIPKGAAPWAWLRSGPPAEGETSLATPVEPADDVP